MNALFYAALLTFIQLSFQNKLIPIGDNSERTFSVRVIRLKCLDTPYKLIDLKVCKIKLIRNEPTQIFIEFDMPTILDKMYARFTVNYKINGRFQPMLLDATYELCSALNAKPGVNPAVDYVLSAIKIIAPSAIHPCPYGNRYYNWSGMTLNEKHMPRTIPAGDYRADILMTDKHNVTMLNFQCYLAVRAKGIASLSMMDW